MASPTVHKKHTVQTSNLVLSVFKKYQYYRSWYQSMTKKDRDSFLGVWVAERANIFGGIIKEIQQSAKGSNFLHHIYDV